MDMTGRMMCQLEEEEVEEEVEEVKVDLGEEVDILQNYRGEQ